MTATAALRLRLTLSVALAGMALVSCKPGATEEGPPLPSSDSMQMDLSLFTSQSKAARIGEKTNFMAAKQRVGLLNLAVAAALAPPTLVFAAALSTPPSWEDGKWIYDYEVHSGANVFAAKLSAWFDGNLREGVMLNLEMMVTCTGCNTPTENFVWYTGQFNTDGTDGYWQFFSPEIEQMDQSFGRIDYDVTDFTHKSVTFTNNRTDGHETAGDTVQYLRDDDVARVSVHDESTATNYVVEWSVSTGSGYIEVPGYNGGARACWDEAQVNTPCM